MSKVLVLYYSTYGHIETMAQAVAERIATHPHEAERIALAVTESLGGRGLFGEGLGAGEPRGGVRRSGGVGRRHEGPTRLARRPRGQ